MSEVLPLQRPDTLSTAQSLVKCGFLTSLTLLMDVIAGFISYHFAGKYGHDVQQVILGVYGVGIVFSVLPFIRYLDQAFAVLASRHFGVKKCKELGVLYQKHLLFIAYFVASLLLMMIMMGFALQYEGVFIRSMIPSVIATCLFDSMKYFLIAQNIIITPTIVTLSLIPVQALLCYIFVDVLDMHFSGIGFAKSITDVIAAILLFSYIRFTGGWRDTCTWLPLTKEFSKNCRSHIKKISKFGGIVYNEFLLYVFAFFFTVFLFLKKSFEFGFEIHDAAFALAYAFFCIPWGISLAMQTKIGHVIVEGSHEKVKKILAAGIALNSIFSLIAMSSIIIFRKQIASYFYTDRPSSEIFENMVLFYAIAFTFDSYSNIIGGVLTGVGKEKQTFPWWILVVVIQFLFVIVFRSGYIAVWRCLVVFSFLKFAYLVYALCILDWEDQIQKAKRDLDEQLSGETQNLVEFTDMT